MTEKPVSMSSVAPTVSSGEWFQQWFDSPYYHWLYQYRDEEEAELFIDKLLEELNPAPGARVLDLACGRGRYSRHLAETGFEVTGLDLSPGSIAYARRFETERLSFFQHDMRLPFRVNYFDFVFNFFTSFGYFDSEKDDIKTLRNVALGLRPRGVFVLDFFNSRYVVNRLIGREVKVIDDLTFHIEKEVKEDRVIKSISFEDQGKAFFYQERVRLFHYSDFVRLFRLAGLTITMVYGDYALRPFDVERSPRLILVSEKND